MKERLLLGLALLLLASYSIHIAVRIRQLEARIPRHQIERQAKSQITYAFDDSFIQYFGEKGVAAVESALRRSAVEPQDILRDFKYEDRLRLDIR